MSDFTGDVTTEDICNAAEKEGLVAFFPEPNEIFLDLDAVLYSRGELALNDPGTHAGRVRTLLDRNFNIIDDLVTVSKSGRGRHVYYRLGKPIPYGGVTLDFFRLVWQVALGSDPVKEVLSLLRVSNANARDPIALFETPAEAERVEQWRAQERVDDDNDEVAF